jgi:SAM-dependent methyltransferase
MSLSMDDRRNGMAAVWDSIGDDYGTVSPFLVETAELLVEMAQLRQGERVIDLGTGNGHGLVPAARAVSPARVVGVDISDVMLDAARARAESAGVDNVELHHMDVTALEFPDASFDVALASTVFQFVGYSPAALVEWRRILVPGGRLVFSVPVSLGFPFEDLMRDFFTRLPVPIQEARLARGAKPGALEVPDLAELCAEAGYANAQVDEIRRTPTFASLDDWWAFHWTHGARSFLLGLPEDALEDMRAEADRRLKPTLLPNGEVPMATTMRVCRAST